MKAFDHIIIGGGICGTMAAEAIRARTPDASVLIVGAESHRLYSRVMLPHVIRGRTSEDKAFLRAEESYSEKGIDFLRGVEVTAVDPSARVVTFSNGDSARYVTALLIATGGSVRKLSCAGAEIADAMYFQTMDDMRRIKETAARTALVYGGGFIGLELLMSFVHMGLPTVSVVRGKGYFARLLDARGAELVADAVRGAGVDVRLETDIVAVERAEGMKRVHLTRGNSVTCDAIGVGIGITPNVAFLEGSGIAVGSGVLTDASLRASVPGVFAAGDVAEAPDAFTGTRRVTGNWQNAMFQGKTAGANMAGAAEEFAQLTTYSIAVFGLPVCFMGATEETGERLVRETAQGSLQLFLHGGR
ncbi:MAG: hypothetical protein RLZZ324_1215, partial [Candidatus Parcubacteria bacterium]